MTTGMGIELMGLGVAKGEHRAIELAQRAISSPPSRRPRSKAPAAC